jgi:LacI family transcriptional regulator
MSRSNEKQRPPTILDVAREASVGVMSVSRVINDNQRVKAGTRAKVLKAIAKIGYAPNDAARMLRGYAGRTIGLIVPDVSDYFAACFHAVQEVVIDNGYQTLVVATGKSPALEDRQIESLLTHRVAGLVIVTSGSDGIRLKRMQERGTPIVALDRPAIGVQIDSVLVENRIGAESGVRHLIEHGHKRIACVGFDSGSFTTRERIEGYKRAMRKAALSTILCDRIDSLEEMHELVRSWTKAKHRPTAVFSIKRNSSIILIQALHSNKMRVPQDIAMVGFDDFELAEVLGTPLTVVRQPTPELARAAAELLFKKISNLHADKPLKTQAVKILFPAKLIVRSSCGCTGND